MRMSCKGIRISLYQEHEIGGTFMYVCNCNGIRERDVLAALDAGAERPSEVFRHCQAAPQCAKCVCDVQRMIRESGEALRYAAQ